MSNEIFEKKAITEKNFPEKNNNTIFINTNNIIKEQPIRDKDWDATITTKPKAKQKISEKPNLISNSVKENNIKKNLNVNSLKSNQTLITTKNKKNIESIKQTNLTDSKILSTSSNQSKKDEDDSNKSFKISEKNSVFLSKGINNTIPNAINTKTSNKNEISAISFQF